MALADLDFQQAIRVSRRELARPSRRLSGRDLVVPLLEHGTCGALWLGGGYWVLQAYNESVLGFVGILMMLWGGGFKGMVLLGTYGIALYAALFRRDWFRFVAERRHIARVNARIERDLESGKVERAMDRIHGLLCAFPDNLMLRWRLAVLLMAEERAAEAGRYLVLQPKPNEAERAAIAAFCRAHGHDPFQILRKAVRGVKGLDLPRASRAKLRELHRAITREADRRSGLYRAVGRYLDFSFQSDARVLWTTYRATWIELAALAAVFLALYLLKQL